jgi:hypothetical protein
MLAMDNTLWFSLLSVTIVSYQRYDLAKDLTQLMRWATSWWLAFAVFGVKALKLWAQIVKLLREGWLLQIVLVQLDLTRSQVIFLWMITMDTRLLVRLYLTLVKEGNYQDNHKQFVDASHVFRTAYHNQAAFWALNSRLILSLSSCLGVCLRLKSRVKQQLIVLLLSSTSRSKHENLNKENPRNG